MLNLSIMSMMENHVEEMCADIIEQQRTGVSNCAMLMMFFNPEGTPAVKKAEKQCVLYDRYREILDAAGVRSGVLVQATLGHITKPFAPYPFQPTVSLVTGEEFEATCCPLDPNYHDYIREQFRVLAEHKPSVVMLDDDIGLLYRRHMKGCACKYHLAEFARRAGKVMTREEIYKHTQGESEEDKYYTQLYVDTQREGIVSAVRAMREGLDMVDPTIRGIVSGIYLSTFTEFSDETAVAFAGKGNPATIRLNGGPYEISSAPRGFTERPYRVATLRETVKDKVQVFLAETDTCPHNRYSTSAAFMHAHFVASILEGANGAKHWISRTSDFEPNAGKAYRKILSQHEKFYKKVAEYAKELSPFGCRIPLSKKQNYGFGAPAHGIYLSPWATCVLERLGLPLYFGNTENGAVFLDDYSVDRFEDEEISNFMKGVVILSAVAAEKLNARGFEADIGVLVRPWKGVGINGEFVEGKRIAAQYALQELVPMQENIEVLSESYYHNAEIQKDIPVFPAVTKCKNTQGGETIVLCGTPDMPFAYYTAFSLLCEPRKNQLIKILSQGNYLPIYYPEDGEIYLRAGRLSNGEYMVAAFNLGFDVLEDFALMVTIPVNRVETLLPDGTRTDISFERVGDMIRIKTEMRTLMPQVFFLS